MENGKGRGSDIGTDYEKLLHPQITYQEAVIARHVMAGTYLRVKGPIEDLHLVLSMLGIEELSNG